MSLFNRCFTQIQHHAFLSISAVAALAIYGSYAKKNVTMDAIPNISPNQVIVTADWHGQSPKDVEDQVTYPLSVAMLAVPGATSVRGKSMFGFSFVQVTFSDSTDPYWARSRVTEQLLTAAGRLPEEVRPVLGPDATGLGQIFTYVLESAEPLSSTQLRTVQDDTIRYALQSVEGVSEVASIGGFVREYQVDVDPTQLRRHNIGVEQIVSALKAANSSVGAKTLEQGDMEFLIRGKGFLARGTEPFQILTDIENSVVQVKNHIPVQIKHLATVHHGTQFRRGALDYNGTEAVGGIVVMRIGQNPRSVIAGVKAKIAQLEPSLGGITITPVYDRSQLITETVQTLHDALFEQILITMVVIFIFLTHVKTSLVVGAMLPLSVTTTFIFMRHMGLDANVMSLAGIVIAIGNMVDIAIVLAENIYTRLAVHRHMTVPERVEEIAAATTEMIRPLTAATATTVLSFLPIFFLGGRDHKLFAPLALTKTLALLGAVGVAFAVLPLFARFLLIPRLETRASRLLPGAGALLGAALALALDEQGETVRVLPALLRSGLGALGGYLLGRAAATERMVSTDHGWVSALIAALYGSLLRHAFRHKLWVAATPLLALGLGCVAWTQLKTDDWIGLDEGSFFYMPTMYPGISFSKAYEILQTQNSQIKKIPEVAQVLGKIGRADSALDPAPAAMIETQIILKDKAQWRSGIGPAELWQEISERATLPGVTPAALLQPIEGRVVMLQTGIKAPMAIRIYGDSTRGLELAAAEVARHLKTLDPVETRSVNPDFLLGKPYLEFEVDRVAAARYGMHAQGVNQWIAIALGGATVGYTVEGRERYPIRVRYPQDRRDHLGHIQQLPVLTASGATVPLSTLAAVATRWGPAVISSENARLVAHVSFAPRAGSGALHTVDTVMASLHAAQRDGTLNLPPGYEIEPVGSFQSQRETNRTLQWVVPLVIVINLIIIYLLFGTWWTSLLAFSGIPLAFGGGMLLLWLCGTQLNTAVWIGFIALFGISVDNGVLLASYLEERFRTHPATSPSDVITNAMAASQRRARPCLMTTTTTVIALLPVLVATGKGADVARNMAMPILGGSFSALLVLVLVPVLYAWREQTRLPVATLSGELPKNNPPRRSS